MYAANNNSLQWVRHVAQTLPIGYVLGILRGHTALEDPSEEISKYILASGPYIRS